jgi:hypothetical protein
MTAAYSAPAVARNREPILEVLRSRLPAAPYVLELASGSGEHAAYMAAALPQATWRPTDMDDKALASIAAWRAEANLPNLLPPLRLDASDPSSWPGDPANVVVCINMVHISPWQATIGLMTGAGARLPSGGRLFLYGPYRENGVLAPESNVAFDLDLRHRNPLWGIRDREAVTALAAEHGLQFLERIAMPANNLVLVYGKP